MSRETELIEKLKELNYYTNKFEEVHKYLRGTYQYEFTGSFQVPRQAIDIDYIKLDSELLKVYVESELERLKKEKAYVYQELGKYVEVDSGE